MDWKEARSDIQFIAGIEFGAFAARAFRISGATVVAWQEGTTRILCRLTASEEQEAQEAIKRGDGERVAGICRGAKRITLAIEHKWQALEWQEVINEPEERTQQEIPVKEKEQKLENEWIRALSREELKREEAERMRREWDELHGCQAIEEAEYRRAFDEEVEKLFPRRRQNEMMKKIVNRERFE
jgi:alkylated DNA nucleotide flippase Atl1